MRDRGIKIYVQTSDGTYLVQSRFILSQERKTSQDIRINEEMLFLYLFKKKWNVRKIYI